MDAVVCAQAFHWFSNTQSLAEIRRVLKPGGSLGLVWNVRDEQVEWVKALNEIINSYTGSTPRFSTGVLAKRISRGGVRAFVGAAVYSSARRGSRTNNCETYYVY